MMTDTVLPDPKAVRDVVLDLLGRDIAVNEADTFLPPANEPLAVAVYVDDQTRTAALIVLDLPLAAFMGAAIGLIPKGGAEVCLEDGRLTPPVRDNIGEVFNIMASILNLPGNPHVRLYGVHEPGERPASDVEGYIRALGMRLDLSIDISGYGKGRFAVIFT